MSPELKFHSLIIGSTTLIVFIAWTQLTDLISNYPITSIVASGLISLGIYRSLAAVLLNFFRNISWVKKWILGPHFMEGTWAGFYVGHENKIKLFIETFEQGLTETVIRGKAFKENGSYHGSWVSDTTNINVKLGTLSYTYEADIIGTTFINSGLARFNLERPAKDKPPHRMIGFSSDLFNPSKLKAFEEKVSDKTTIESTEALNKAREIYEKNKYHT